MKSFFALSLLAPLAMAQDLCDQYASTSSNGWIVNNNAWGQADGSGSQCTHVDTINADGATWSTDWSWSGGDSLVKSYPNSGLDITSPKLLSDIGSMPSKAEWAYSGDNIKADVAYDLFTAYDPSHDKSSGDFELMIWLSTQGDMYPIGSNTGTVTIDGNEFELWDGYNGAMHVYSFRATSDIPTFESDVKLFYQYLNDNVGYPSSSLYLITFQFGTEPVTGSNAVFNCWYWYGLVQ